MDTTGAGDVFHGGYLYGVLQGWELREDGYLRLGGCRPRLPSLGGRAGIPTLAEAMRFMGEE